MQWNVSKWGLTWSDVDTPQEGSVEADLKVRRTDLDFLSYLLNGLVIQGSWAPPQPQGVKFD